MGAGQSSSNLAAGFGTYYVLCGAWIYTKVAPWCLRPRLGASNGESGGGGDGDDDDDDTDHDGPTNQSTPRGEKQRRLRVFVRMGPSRGPDANPFCSDCWRLSEGERIKMALLGPILVPVRVAGLAATTLAIVLLATVAVAGVPRKHFECGSTRPLAAWRRAFRFPIRALGRILMFWMGYLYIEEEGKPAPLSEAPIVVANHLGPIEPFILAIRTGGMPVSKLENASLPFFGSMAKVFLPIFVDRNDADSKRNVKDEIESRARGAAEGRYSAPVFLFPEGTCTNGDGIITFKAGAFSPRLPVQPAVVRFPHPPGSFYPSWTVVGPSLPELIIRMLCQPWNRCKITWLPAVGPLPEETSEWPGPKLFACRVQDMVAKSLGAETTQFAFEDVMLMREAQRIGDKHGALATGGAAVEFKRMQEFVDLDVAGAKRYLESFNALDKTCNGELTFEEFQPAFGANLSPEMCRSIFDLLDDDCSGRLDFREFLVGASLLHATSDEGVDSALELGFKIFDVKNEGRLDFENAQRILRVVYPDVGVDNLREAFDDMDQNGDGMLDEAEFVSWVKRNEEALPQMKRLLFH